MAGCGGGGGGGTPAPPPSSGSTTDPIVSSVPAKNAKGVMIDDTLKVVFSTEIDATTVNATNVKLMPTVSDAAQHSEDPALDDMQQIPGVPTLSADKKTLTFEPSEHLHLGTLYHLRLAKIKTAAGVALAATQIDFQTINNNELTETNYETRDPATIGQITDYETYEYDTNGNRIKTNIFGPDKTTLVEIEEEGENLPIGTKFATEIVYSVAAGVNTVTRYRANIKNAAGTVTAHVTYTGAGVDTVWGTADDTVGSFTDHNHNHVNPLHWTTQSFRPVGTTPVTWNGSFTDPNFQPRFTQLRIVDNFQRTLMQINYTSIGTNGIDLDASGNPKPVDDVVRSYTRVERDSGTGERLAEWSYSDDSATPTLIEGAGPDGIILTADDVPTSYQTYEYNATMHLVRRVNYTSPGPDLVWTTFGDNDASSVRNYNYTTNDLLTTTVRFAAGLDKRVDTTDDIKAEESTYDTTK